MSTDTSTKFVGDFHLHSTYSDGILSPAALVDLASEQGVTMMSLTDHDSTEGIAEARSACRDRGITLVPGCEVSTDIENDEVHVLGHFLDPADPRNFGTLDDSPVELGIEETPELERALADARAAVEPTKIEAEYVWSAGDPGRKMVELAQDRHADLVVIGGHHEGFFRRTFGMSVQDEVKKHADCEVIVVE